ncbi:phage minor head protein [Candidatus Sororendozoicomonas aggregata]|uniref:phage minor head protein n=1 Tax=Candidatus Sororendozoicomonas aggregata TaxID=3073239 RepID=UPI002ED648F1
MRDEPGFAFPSEPAPEVLDYFNRKKLKPSFSWMDVWKQEHQSVFTVAKAMQLDILQDLLSGVLTAIREGQTLQQFRQQLTPLLQKKGWWGVKEMTNPNNKKKQLAQLGSPRRLRVIYETNLRTAHAAGQWHRVQRTKKTHPYLRYELGPSKEHRKEHVQWQGLTLPVDDPFWDTHYPQNGWGCKCRVRQVSTREYQRTRGKSPNRAPEIKRNEWINKRTGEIQKVPEGIDPGWDYNPGKRRLNALEQRVIQQEQQLRQALKKPAPRQRVTVPAPFSTVKGVNGQQINRVLNELGTKDSRQLFGAFLKAHPIQSCLLKSGEIGGSKAPRNKALQAQIAQYLGGGLSPLDAFRRYGSPRSVSRTNGFTKAAYELVTVKVKAGINLASAESAVIQMGVKPVLAAAKGHSLNAGRLQHYSVSGAVGQGSPEQVIITLIHELGHQVHFWGGAPVFADRHRLALTEYSRDNHEEWFAEHFAAWFIDPVGVKAWNPEAAAFIETTLIKATQTTSPVLKGR